MRLFVPIKDLESPYVIFTSPADNTSGIVTSANISITFSEEVVRGTGKIKISELTTNELFEEIDVENKEQVEFLGTDTIRINPTNNLKSGTEYFVNMTRGTVSDPSGNKFGGIAGTETYNFSTREVSKVTDPPVGIITGFVPVNPGIGYTSGDDAVVGDCRFELILTQADQLLDLKQEIVIISLSFSRS